MTTDRLPRGSENKEVVSRPRKNPNRQVSRSKPVAGKIRNALLLAGGLQALGGGASVLPGCSAENGSRGENIGQVSQALANGWNAPTAPSLGVSANIAYVERSGSNITLYIVEGGDVKKIGTADGGLNWNSPTLTAVPGANSGNNEFDFKVCGGKAYEVSERDGVSSKLYEGTWSGGVASGWVAVPGTLNSPAANVNRVGCDNSGTNIFASSDISSSNQRIHTAVIGTWTWSELTSCSDPTQDTYGTFVDTSDFYVVSNRTGTVGGFDLMVYNGGWNGVTCTGGVTNLNAVAGSAMVNNASNQGSMYLDNQGDLWYSDNGTIKWATKKTGGGDGGAGGTGGDSGTGGDAGTGGVDAGTGGDAGVGGDAGAPPDGGGGTGGDSGTGGTGTGGDSGTGGSGGDSGTGGTGGDSGTGGTGGDSGTGGTGTGGDSGTGGSGGDSGTGGTGGDSGTGGSDAGPNCDLVNVTENVSNFQIDNCTATTVSAHINGPTTFRIGNTTYIVEGVVPMQPNNFSYEAPKFPVVGNGIELIQDETETDPSKKIVDYQYGDITGYEGTKVRKWVPAELNPNKNNGEMRIVATTTLEGLQRKYIADGCDKTQLTTCTPNEQYGNSGEIPAGVTKYKELSTGQVSENPADFDVIPPVQNKSEDDGGCSVSGHVGSTRDDLALIFAGLGLAAVMRRRKQD